MNTEANLKTEEEVDLIELIAIPLREWKLILKSTIICSIIAVIVALILSPYYTSSAVIVPRSAAGEQTRMGALGAFGSMLGMPTTSLSNNKVLATANSWYYRRDLVRRYNIKPILFPKLWDGNKKLWLTESGNEPSDYEAVRRLVNSLSFSENIETGFITVRTKTADSLFSKRLVENAVEFLDEELAAKSKNEEKSNREFLEKQFENATDPVIKERIAQLIANILEKEMISSYRFIDVIVSPVVPDMKAGPSRRLIAIVGFFVGIIIGIACSYIMAYFSKWLTFIRKSFFRVEH